VSIDKGLLDRFMEGRAPGNLFGKSNNNSAAFAADHAGRCPFQLVEPTHAAYPAHQPTLGAIDLIAADCLSHSP